MVALAAFLVVMELAFFIAGSFFARPDSGLEGGKAVEGTVVATPPLGDDGTCVKRVRYQVDGVAYEATSTSASAGACGKIGGTAKVSYLPSAPSTARVIDGQSGWFSLAFQLFGAVVILQVAHQIVTGIRSENSGRPQAAAGSGSGSRPLDGHVIAASLGIGMGAVFLRTGLVVVGHDVAPPWVGVPFFLAGFVVAASAIRGLVRAVRHRTDGRAPVRGGPVDGDRGFDLTDLTFSDATRGTARPREGAQGTSPHPGWYADPAGLDRRRWWDGQVWTDHLK
jgi:hypothetical protein